ncbi:MAG: FxLYD domain-containing protein [Ignavibacteriales bacterium]
MKIGIYVSAIVISFLLLPGSVHSKENYSSQVEAKVKPTYQCSAGHLHIPGIVENKSNLTLEKIMVEGRAYDEKGNLISSTSSLVDSDTVAPGKTAPFDLEFTDIVGSANAKVKSYDVKVIEAEKASH